MVLLYAVTAIVLAVSGISNTGFLSEGRPWPLAVSVALMLVAAVSLLWRRRHPVVPLVVAGPLGMLELLVGGQITAFLMLFEALFEPIIHGSRRLARTATAAAAAVSVLAVLTVLALDMSIAVLWALLLVITVAALTPLLWGWEVRHHREARRAAEALAGAERELAATRAAHAVESERRQIAHDLHDVIAGHLSAVTLHTSLAGSLTDREARDRSLATSRESARAALRDLRSMIGVLSSDSSGVQPAVTLSWEVLSERLRSRDPSARIRIDPALEDPARVDGAVQAALLRIAAEAVTNAVRHGRAPISLAVLIEPTPHALSHHLTFRLENERAERSAPGGVGAGGGTGAGGVGVESISHRATAVGGTATSGPLGPTRWQVLARLPLTAPARGLRDTDTSTDTAPLDEDHDR